MNNKEIMSKNIKYYLSRKHLNVKDFAKQLGFKYTTVLVRKEHKKKSHIANNYVALNLFIRTALKMSFALLVS